MEEEIMKNIDIRDFSTVSKVDRFDYVVLSLFAGKPAKITVEMLRKVIAEGIMPTVGENGNWFIGLTDTKVKARGDTPEFRKTTSGIEYKYTTEDDASWRPLISFYDMRLRYDDLTPEQRDSFRMRFSDLKESEIKELQKPAEDAMKKIDEEMDNQILALEMDADGSISILTGAANTEFEEGYIEDDGSIILEFKYEEDGNS